MIVETALDDQRIAVAEDLISPKHLL